MKVELLDRFAPTPPETPYSTFCYYQPPDSDDNDLLFVGAQNGEISSFEITRRLTRHNLKADKISKGSGHTGTVSCLIYTLNPRLCHSPKSGLLISGSSDRTIKIWSPTSLKPIVQTLVGHNGSIASVQDGGDGTLVSCAVDGGLRVWTLQRGRNLMLHPFFECTFSLVGSKDISNLSSGWLNAMCVNSVGVWSCYVGDMGGNIEVYKKGNDANEVDGHVASFTGQLTKFARWERVHRLGISSLVVASEDNYLVTLSYDCTCKILDASQGQMIYLIENNRRCMFTGVLWKPELMTFTFVDELGYLDVFSVLSEKLKDSLSIIAPSPRQQKSILSSHKNPMLSIVTAYKESQHYLSLIPEQGVVLLWNATFDDQCVEYIGHVDSIVNIACLPTFQYVPPPTEALDTHPRRSSRKIRHESKDFGGLPDPDNNIDSSIALLAVSTGLKGFDSERELLSARSDHSIGNPTTNFDGDLLGGFAKDNNFGRSTSLKICKEENIYFSCSADGIIRCWDEFLRAEMYQFKYDNTDSRESSVRRDKAVSSGKTKLLTGSSKGQSTKSKTASAASNRATGASKKLPKSYNDIYSSQHVEITCMMMLWDYNCIVTGSEDGAVCMWNADLGNKLVSRTLCHTVTALVTASTKKSDVLCASDISGKIAIWNLSLFRKNPTQLVLTEVIPTSFHSFDEPGITCMSFHGTTGVMFTGGMDGTVRYWRLNVDNEAYCLTRPPDHLTKTAVEYAIASAPTKHSPPKPVHTSEEARLRHPGGFPLLEDETSLCSSATFASDTTSIQNYKLEKNLGQVVESLCAMESSENFLLTGDDSGEILLWAIHSTANESNAGLSAHHYQYIPGHQDTPYVIVLPLIRFYNNNHNPFKACMTLQQSSLNECFVVQGGCGRTANRISLWRVTMADKPGESGSSVSDVGCKTSSNASISKVDSRVILETSSEADSKSPTESVGATGEKKGGRLAFDDDEKDDYYATDGEEGDVDKQRVGEDSGSKDQDRQDQEEDDDDQGEFEGEMAGGSSEEKRSFRQKEYECLLTHPNGVFLSSTMSDPDHDGQGHELGAKGENGFGEDVEPEIPANSYLASDHHVLLGLRNIAIKSITNTFNYPLTPLMQPSCLKLQLIYSGDIKVRAGAGTSASRKFHNQRINGRLHHSQSAGGGSLIVPQFLYVGLGDGPIYKIVLI